MTQLKAHLRVCGSCQWIFHRTEATDLQGCPKCGFAHYGARMVFGDSAYRYASTQKPWFDANMARYASELRAEITTQAPGGA